MVVMPRLAPINDRFNDGAQSLELPSSRMKDWANLILLFKRLSSSSYKLDNYNNRRR